MLRKQTTKQRGNLLISHWLYGVAALLFFSNVNADDASTLPPPSIAKISIIIDDMGDKYDANNRAIQLPGAVTYSFLPHTPFSKPLAEVAHQRGKEVMIHLPMESMHKRKLGPGGLTMNMTRSEFDEALHGDLTSIPHAVGVNNHMGSLLTRHPGHMQWFMETLKRDSSLYFIDSRTTHLTVAAKLARENQVPVMSRDVFLDDDPSLKAIAFQFTRLVKRAKRKGRAIAIGHPYDTTLAFLEQILPQLQHLDLELVSVSQLLKPQPKQLLAEPEPSQRPSSDHLVLNKHNQPLLPAPIQTVQ